MADNNALNNNIGVATGVSLNLGSSTVIDGFLDEDDMSSDNQTKGATQQSIKAYVDSNINKKNLIIGGNFATNPWQYRTVSISAASGVYSSADRWVHINTGTAVVDLLKTADSPTAAQSGIFSNQCFHVDVTTTQATVLSSSLFSVLQDIEGYNFAAIAQNDFTISFWVKAEVTGTYCVALNGPANQSYIAEYTIDAAKVWEKKVITVPASPSAGAWNYTNGTGIRLAFCLMSGSNFQTTANSWQVGTFYSTANQVNAMANSSLNFKINLVQVEIGKQATPFEVRTVSEELALCQRYLYKTFPQGKTVAQGASVVGSVGYRSWVAGVALASEKINFPVTMRSTPGITFYNPVNLNSNWYNSSTGLDSGPALIDFNGDSSVTIQNSQVAGDFVSSAISIHIVAYSEL